MYVCVYVCVFVCVCVSVSLCVCVGVSVFVCGVVSVSVSLFARLCLYGCLCACRFLCVCGAYMAKGSEIILFAPNFLAMPFALRHVQVVRSIAWRSDQTAKNCLLTPPPPVPPLHLLNDYAKCSVQTGMYQMPHLESAHTSPHALLSCF